MTLALLKNKRQTRMLTIKISMEISDVNIPSFDDNALSPTSSKETKLYTQFPLASDLKET